MMEKEYYEFATYFRVLGVIFILLCHFVQESSTIYFNLSAQFFNIGVSMFFILSGFLFGVRGGGEGEHEILRWYKKRLKRIYIPFELFCIILFIIHCCIGFNVLKIDWLFLFLGLQGSVVGIQGAGQTWFITALLLCYFLTPLISKCLRKEMKQKLYVVIISLIPCVLCAVPYDFVFTLFAPICWYAIAYFIGLKYKKIKFSHKVALSTFAMLCIVFGLRLLGRIYFDGSVLYNRLIVNYTQTIAAFCILFIVAWLTQNRVSGKIVKFISGISFEIYLYHYMFTVGPVKIFELTGSWIADSIIVTLITVCIAFLMNDLSTHITKKFFD